MNASANTIPVGILGASGYIGAELVRLLAHHPNVDIRLVTADRRAGEAMGDVFPHLAGVGLPAFSRIEDADFSGLETVFLGLPHGTTQEVVMGLPGHLRVIDLSADFRLNDTDAYARWYGHEHRAPKLQADAVYALTELNREAIAVSEANRLGIPIVAAVDSNCDPEMIDFVVPGNDDSLRAIQLYCARVGEACAEGAIVHNDRIQAEVAAEEKAKGAEAEKSSTGKVVVEISQQPRRARSAHSAGGRKDAGEAEPTPAAAPPAETPPTTPTE